MEPPNPAEEAKLMDLYKQELAKLGENTERVMRRHPYAALGVAALAGMIIGLLIGRRS